MMRRLAGATGRFSPPMTLSFVIPFYNEKENLPLLLDRLLKVCREQKWSHEVILVDDGSTDGYRPALAPFLDGREAVRLIRFRANYGQTAAIQAGFEAARGEVVVTLDADLQNDPEDLPRLLAKMEEGYDVVSGWRRRRQDPFLHRRLPSLMANLVVRWITGIPLHDFGCTLKAYRRTALSEFRLYGEMHRFIPVFVSWHGGQIAEMEVTHHPRVHGSSKYGMIRVVKVLLDLITIKFLGDFSTKPLYFFGGAGFLLGGIGVILTLVTAVEKLFYGVWVHRNPMLLLAVFFLLMGTQLVLIGLLAEMSMRHYYESLGRKTYSIRETIGRGLEPGA